MTRAALRRLGLCLLWAGSLAGIAYGLHRLEPYARGRGEAKPWRLEWGNRPPPTYEWVLEDIEQERQRYDLRPLYERDLHDAALCADLGTALAGSPWIASVQRISKRPDGVVRVNACFRRPLSFVVKNRRGFRVDEVGVRLPGEYTVSALEGHGILLVEGVREPLPEIGQAWPGGDIIAGLQLVKFLTEECPAGLLGSLRAVDVSNYDNRLNSRDGWLRIRTIHTDSYILWGLPPVEEYEYDVESTAQRKLEYLWSLYSEYGQLPDRGAIDVRSADSILLRDAP